MVTMAVSKTSTTGRFLTHVVPAVLRPLRVLWNEVFGFIFLVLATFGGINSFRSWGEFARGEAELMKFLLPAIFTAVMTYFGVTSFLRARKISRS